MTFKSKGNAPVKGMLRRQLRILRLSERDLARSNASIACAKEEDYRLERSRVERAIYEEEYEVLALSIDDVEVEEFMSWLPEARRDVAKARRLEAGARIDMLYTLTALELAYDAFNQTAVSEK